MINVRLVRGRIKSAKNIAQITKAMELVAAAKMRKAQAVAQAGKLYAQKIYEMVTSLSGKVDTNGHPLLAIHKKAAAKKLVLFISTNKGLCGGLNTNLFRFFLKNLGDKPEYAFVTLGKKGAQFVTHLSGSLQADFSSSTPFVSIVSALSDLLIGEYLSGRVNSVELVYNDCVSALRQEPRHKTILPLTIDSGSTIKRKQDVTIEPNPEAVFAALLPHYLENQLREAILEADASEHSARMIAMRNATDNARSFITELTLIYNKARQEKITSEIADMVTARLAVE